MANALSAAKTSLPANVATPERRGVFRLVSEPRAVATGSSEPLAVAYAFCRFSLSQWEKEIIAGHPDPVAIARGTDTLTVEFINKCCLVFQLSLRAGSVQ